MKTEAIIATILLVGSVLPLASARHLSAGFEDSVGVGVDETPEDPSVPVEDWERGTTREGCFESEGNLSAQAANEAVTADPFCGELIYHQNTSLEHIAPQDQVFLDDDFIGEFDVHNVNYMGSAIERWDQPFVDPVWSGIHDAGQILGMTDSAEEADEQDGDRTQAYHVALYYPFATHVLQEQTGAWEMNGPYSQEPYQAFMGFLYDSNGEPITDEDLKNRIAEDDVRDNAIPAICGFQPFSGFAAINAIGPCGIQLTYIENGDSEDFRGYEDECESPAYVCNPAAGGAWHGRIQCTTTCAGNSEFSHEIFHWVVAPVLEQDCDQRAPGFSMEHPGDGLPYLAHDLDVYTPTASAVEQASFPTTWEWANDAPDTAIDRAFDETSNVTEEINDLLQNISDELPGAPPLPPLPDTQNVTTFVDKGQRIEPNAHPAGELVETSQSLSDDPDLQRSSEEDDGPCAPITSDSEVEDPWVDIVDGETNLGVTGQRSGSGLENFVGLDLAGFTPSDTGLFGVGVEKTGLYLTAEDHQDGSNRPGPATVWTEGKVGMFTDMNDDGDYDQVFLGAKYQPQNVESVGAYPMLWDMWATENGEPDLGQGCTIVGGKSITQLMDDAGYGANTGLAQLIYLNEPTVFFDPATGEAVPYPDGNNIFVLASNSVHQLWEPEGTQTHQLGQEISAAIEDLSGYAEANNDGQGPPDVRIPADDLGMDANFQGQCDEPTGGFTSSLTFVHDCAVDCSGDTIATVYSFEVTRENGDLGGGDEEGSIPVFSTDQTERYDFGQGQHTWIDVDPFDGDPDRNREESSAPPT